MALERVGVINRALVRIGALPRAAADLSHASHDLVMTYEARMQSALTVYPWACTRKTLQLTRGERPDACDYKYAYLLPSDCMGLALEAWSDPACEAHQQLKLYEYGIDKQGRTSIFTSAEYCVVKYQKLAPPVLWSPPLLELVTLDLMSAFALQVRQDRAQMLELHELAWGVTEKNVTGQYHKAKNAEAVRTPSKVVTLENGPLLNARF
jgi:hypothetical protein